MKKTEMIKVLKALEEKEWRVLCALEDQLGENHELTARQRFAWAAMNEALEALNIKTDYIR